jgi:hypothetical protein
MKNKEFLQQKQLANSPTARNTKKDRRPSSLLPLLLLLGGF